MIEYIKTLIIRLANNIEIDAGTIKNAKVNTSPTNLVVSEIPTPTVK